MHNDDIERPDAGDDDPHDGVVAADDTGMISQQQLLTDVELGEGLPDDAEAGGP